MKAPIAIFLLLLAACTERQAEAPDETPRAEPTGSGVFDPLTGTLERAEGVEQTLQDSAAERRRALEAAEGR